MELKYKVWDKEQKKFLRIDDEDEGCAKPNYYRSLYFTLNGKRDEDGYPYQIDAEILFYTGLNDINNVEIYEEDIVNYTDGEFTRRKGIIEFDCFGFMLKEIGGEHQIGFLGEIDDFEEFAFKVIGNSFENPELLEVE